MLDRTSITEFVVYDSPISALFEKWREIYTTQYALGDAEADPMMEPLLDVENQIAATPYRTMQEYFYSMTAGTCFGQFSFDEINTPERMRDIMAIADREAKERESLFALIDRHKSAYIAWNELLGNHDSGTPAYEAAGGEDLSDREQTALAELIGHPCNSISNVILKGRYLAALQAAGGLPFPEAEDFVRTFRKIGGVTC